MPQPYGGPFIVERRKMLALWLGNKEFPALLEAEARKVAFKYRLSDEAILDVTISVAFKLWLLRQRMIQRSTLAPEGPVQALSFEPFKDTLTCFTLHKVVLV